MRRLHQNYMKCLQTKSPPLVVSYYFSYLVTPALMRHKILDVSAQAQLMQCMLP